MLESAHNDTLILRKVTEADLSAVYEYRQEFLDNDDSMDGTSNLRKFEDMDQWYHWIQQMENPDTCPDHWVPDTQFICVRRSDGKLVGMLDIRHRLNDLLLRVYGNIGYSIRASERRKGYAIGQLALALDICRSMGMEKVLVSCDKDNPASAKTIIRNGGILENECIDETDGALLQRYWIHLT